MPITNDEFRAALGNFASGITVVTTKDAAGILHGITVSAFSSLSLEPRLVLICVEKTTASHYAFLESGIFTVNILSEGQEAISEQFAAPFLDKFEDIDFEIGEMGLPVLKGALGVIECELRDAFDGGDHSIFVGEIKHIDIREGKPLVYFQGEYGKFDG
jgi:flavin reductase (DIM6/NTAB) family NADH-FMN oxidoreductase RutF